MARTPTYSSFPGESRKPSWIRMKIPAGETFREVDRIVRDNGLHTVCESAQCPNLGECWARGTATIMILGDICTRACGFCAVRTGRPLAVDEGEPQRVAEAVAKMGLRHVVITSVNRDELSDGGASIWRRTIESVRAANPGTTVEVLIPDLMGHWDAHAEIWAARPEILAHNLETVERLTPLVRTRALFDRSCEVLERATQAGMRTKTGFMLGIGEEDAEIESALRRAAATGVRIVTLGQYLRPSANHLPVKRWVHPDEFKRWKDVGEAMGIAHVESGPMVRSSYHAEEQASLPLGR
jgi:lipoyl synthase